MARLFRSVLVSLPLAALAACQAKPPLSLPAGCQPLFGGSDCFVPYPSDFFRVEDVAEPTGFRVDTTGAGRLSTTAGASADVNAGRPIDGFSKLPPIVVAFPQAVSPQGFVRLADPPESSLSAASPTVLIEADTGRFIPHFVDFDPRATDLTRQALVLHPIVALAARTRYVVGIHGAVLKDGGAPVPAPEGFLRLRDGQASGDPALEPLAKRYDKDVFAPLATAGVPRKELQLAWDFTTGSDEWATADMLRVRELTLAWLATHTPVFTLTRVDDNPDSDIWRRVFGTLTMPLFLEKTDPGSKLFRGADGRVAQNGEATFGFEAEVPISVRDQWEPGRPLTYGHGFFGGTNETRGGSARNLCNRMKAVMFATDWWGMALADTGLVADALTGRPSRIFDFTDRVPQGMANWLVLTAAMQGPLRNEAAFQRPASGPGVSTNGGGASNALAVLYGPGAANYIGISQGHILGGVMVALNPDISRAVLQMGGAGFTEMMMRARPFETYLTFLEITVKDPLDQQKYIATLQRPFDRIDPASYARWLLSEKLPGNPDRRVLFENGLGDVQVPNFASWIHARLVGLPVLTPTVYQPWGLETAASPYAGSALALYDFKLDPEATYRDAQPAADDNPVHEGVRKLEPALLQMDRFYSDGIAENFCSGATCDPD